MKQEEPLDVDSDSMGTGNIQHPLLYALLAWFE